MRASIALNDNQCVIDHPFIIDTLNDGH